MSHKATAWAVEQTVGDATAKLLLITIAEAASIEEAECWPSIATLCRRVEASETTVKRKVRQLEELGLLTVTQRSRGNGSSTSNLYRLNMTGGGSKLNPGEGSNLEGGGVQIEPPGGSKAATPPGVQSCDPPRKVRGNRQEEGDSAGAAAGDHKRFVELWVKAYEERFGDAYAFQGAKDGAAVKWLLGSSGLTPEELIDLAGRAWSKAGSRAHFNCRRAITIAGLRGAWNEIRRELSAGEPKRVATQAETEVRDGF